MNGRLLALLVWLGLVSISFSQQIELGATPSEIIVRVSAAPAGTYRLIELPAHTVQTESETGSVAWEGELSGDEIRLPRNWEGRDRLFSRFALRSGSGAPVISNVWVTDLTGSGAREFEFPKATSKKGINCLVDVQDAKDLGLQHANVNINMRALLNAGAARELTTIVDGATIPLSPDYVRYLDRYIGGMTAAGINVTGILLNYFGADTARDDLLHPDTNIAESPNRIGAFNVTSPAGLRLYRAAVQFLVERYTRPDSPHGLMTGMIIGNEVQSHWDWHNQGDARPAEVLRDYHVAVRIADLVARSLHSRFTTFISMDHRWARAANGFRPLRSIPGDRFLSDFARLCREGGDFPWALAFHPYPEDLFQPSFWNDRRAPLSLDPPVITFRNIEVLPVVMRQPQFLYRGAMRAIALTEQGFHRKEGAEGEQAQALALALGYRKIEQMPEIEFFLLHRHQDHPHEGGLNLGVLDGSKRRTKAWAIYQSIDQPNWREAAEGILAPDALDNWHASKLSPVSATASRSADDERSAVFDFYSKSAEAKLTDAADFRPGDIQMDGRWKPAILHHPKGPKHPGRAQYAVQLPATENGKKLVLEFATAIDAPSADGIGFRIAVDGRQLFSFDQRERTPKAHQIDLTLFAGSNVMVELIVDSIGNTAHDLGAWVQPRIIER